jgi:antitoxin VapB
MLTKVLVKGNCQIVQIPQELQFQCLDIEYEITREKDALIIRPARRKLTDILDRFAAFSVDFLAEGWPSQAPSAPKTKCRLKYTLLKVAGTRCRARLVSKYVSTDVDAL